VLARGGVKVLPQLALVARPSAYDDDGDVGLLGGRDGFGEAGFVVGPPLTAFGVGDGACAGGFDAVVGCYSAVLGLEGDVVAILEPC
jgi:hypothetical protein